MVRGAKLHHEQSASPADAQSEPEAGPEAACRLGAIGTTLRLKQRFGSGYQLSVSVMPATATSDDQAPLLAQRAKAVKELFQVRTTSPGGEGGCLPFILAIHSFLQCCRCKVGCRGCTLRHTADIQLGTTVSARSTNGTHRSRCCLAPRPRPTHSHTLLFRHYMRSVS